jgi:tetratricopeptide (TPR) repeat protein
MKRTLTMIVLAFFALSSSLWAETIRLRTGAFLVGKVERVDENILVFRRAGNGGVLELKWNELSSFDAKRLREKWSLLDPEAAEGVKLPALRVVFQKTGGARIEVIGELVSNDGKTMVLRQKTHVYRVPVEAIREGPQNIQVPAEDLVTPDQYYQRKVEELQPGEDADKNAKLADELIRVEDYQRAREHLQKAIELGGGKQPDLIKARLKRVEILLKNKEQADILRKISVLRNRKLFEKARKLVADFAKRFPNSPLRAEFEKRKDLLEKARQRFLIRRVTTDWFETMTSELKRVAMDKHMDFQEAQSFAEEKLGEVIRAKIAKKRGLDPEEVDALFKARKMIRGLRSRKATYGTGSFILGKQGVLKDTAVGKRLNKGKTKTKTSGPNKAQKELQKRIRQYLRRMQRQGQGGGRQQSLQSPESWWLNTTSVRRQQWLIAYYAEHGGDLELLHPETRDCPECGAHGFIEGLGTEGGKTVRLPCPVCHGTRFFRVLRFR